MTAQFLLVLTILAAPPTLGRTSSTTRIMCAAEQDLFRAANDAAAIAEHCVADLRAIRTENKELRVAHQRDVAALEFPAPSPPPEIPWWIWPAAAAAAALAFGVGFQIGHR